MEPTSSGSQLAGSQKRVTMGPCGEALSLCGDLAWFPATLDGGAGTRQQNFPASANSIWRYSGRWEVIYQVGYITVA